MSRIYAVKLIIINRYADFSSSTYIDFLDPWVVRIVIGKFIEQHRIVLLGWYRIIFYVYSNYCPTGIGNHIFAILGRELLFLEVRSSMITVIYLLYKIVCQLEKIAVLIA